MLGIMLMNIGTAAEPTEEAVREHLRVFLADRHLINVPPIIWKPIMNLFILPNRPRKTLPHYQEFWTPEGSPFTLTCFEQRRIIEERLRGRISEPYLVKFAMRYDPPRIGDVMQELADAGCDRIIALPMFPQWTVPCAGTIFDELDDEYAKRFGGPQDGSGAGPRIVKVMSYWQEPGFIQALADSIRRVWEWKPGRKLVMSFHSIPLSYVTKLGDTYLETTKVTLQETARELGIPDEDAVLVYQSRFDSRKWAGPFLVPTVQQLARDGVTDVAVVSPIFSVDCLETHFDTDLETREAFQTAAREVGNQDAHFTYVPALGTDDAFMDVIANLLVKTANEGK